MKGSLPPFSGPPALVGERDICLDTPEGATVSDLKERLAADYPVVGPFLKTLVFAIDDEYVPFDERLHDGAHVDLIPPVSGGQDGAFLLTRDPLDAQRL